MSQPILQIDAFTDKPFTGNPAGVCILERPADETWMQSVAMEMNLAETAFVHPIEGGWSLRWFTPTVEVDLCGHATIAATHALLETGRLRDNETARFNTKSGWLGARLGHRRGAASDEKAAKKEHALHASKSARYGVARQLCTSGTSAAKTLSASPLPSTMMAAWCAASAR